MFSFTTIQTIVQLFRITLNILILWILLYYGVKIVRNNARTSQIFKGIVFILVLRAASDFLGLTAVSWLAGVLVTWGPVAIIIIFQPEIRSVLERLGKTSVFSRLSTLSGNERQKLVDALVDAAADLSTNRIGALITLEQGHSLNNYIATGTQMNSLVSADLIESIFVPTTPLHDGAIIIQGDRIACASAYFPPTTIDLPSKIGARHRAAIGISEITDSITIVISEKSGHISIAEKGVLIPISHSELRNYLEKAIILDLPEVDHTKTIKSKSSLSGLSQNSEKKNTLPKFKAEPPLKIQSEPTEIPAETASIESRSDQGFDAAVPEEDPVTEQEIQPKTQVTNKRSIFGRKKVEPDLMPVQQDHLELNVIESRPVDFTEKKHGFFSLKKKSEPKSEEKVEAAVSTPDEPMEPPVETLDRVPKKTRLSRRAKSSVGPESEHDPVSPDSLLQQINLEYSVSDQSLLEELPEDKEPEVK